MHGHMDAAVIDLDTASDFHRAARLGVVHEWSSHSQFLLFIDSEMIAAVPRTTAREVHRYKAYARHVKAPEPAG